MSPLASFQRWMQTAFAGEGTISLGTILLVLLVLVLLGVIPFWPHSRSWGYVPSSGLLLLAFLVLALLYLGKI